MVIEISPAITARIYADTHANAVSGPPGFLCPGCRVYVAWQLLASGFSRTSCARSCTMPARIYFEALLLGTSQSPSLPL